MSLRRLPLMIACLALVSAGIALNWHSFGRRSASVPRIEFNRDIRPILNQNCISCHGGVKQQGNVSFIYREQALGKGKSGRPTIVPGRANASELIARVTSRDPQTRMPYHAPPLRPKQIATLKEWIKQGAPWEEYWAFVPPKPQPLPTIKRVDCIKQPLDRFILARLAKEGLEPSPPADKAALLRRVSFDLTGLPPTPQELSAFLTDAAPDAYEKQVDRLLASPHYGERWAAMWLDLARYADSKGYEGDGPRPGVWPYRDWVIDSLNQNLPYDQFVVKQLAGDLLPNATFQDLIATSFQRQSPENDEGGTDDEEYRLIAVMDRVATTWSVLNGVTFNCVQCHSHPYDPIRHAEYYHFLAFFNTSRDPDLADDRPTLRVPKDRARFAEAARIQSEMAALRRDVVTSSRQTAADQTQWKRLPIASASMDEVLGAQRWLEEVKSGFFPDEAEDPSFDRKELRKYLKLAVAEAEADLQRARQTALRRQTDGSIPPLKVEAGTVIKVGTVPGRSMFEFIAPIDQPIVTALRLEVWPKDAVKARHTPEEGFVVNGIRAWIIGPDGKETKVPIRAIAPDSETDVDDSLNRLHVVSRYQAAGTADPMALLAENSVFAANSNLFQTRWAVCLPGEPLHPARGSKIKVQLSQTQVVRYSIPAPVPRFRMFASSDERWTNLAEASGLSGKLARLVELDRELRAIRTVPLPVMAEQPEYERRQTLEFERGNFLTKTGPVLAADMPQLFGRLPANLPHDRLAMARGVFAPGQPLTARVAVNRYWEQLFGTGLVETLEDFGSAGEPPSHPELLDWLALHFERDLQWDTKALLRALVLSATYRQSAKNTPVLQEKDPRNRLLARGPQQRLTAEMVRDQALVASGLLTRVIGGPPVMPPQPPRVSGTIYETMKWLDAKGPDRYRRALYTFLKRTNLYPSLLTFDASAHSVSLARRIPTNTPLQALVTLNDPVYQEAAEALARRVMREITPSVAATAPASDELLGARLVYGTRLVLSRDPKADELVLLHQLYKKMLSESAAHSKRGSDRELRAMTSVASVLFNLDAALTR